MSCLYISCRVFIDIRLFVAKSLSIAGTNRAYPICGCLCSHGSRVETRIPRGMSFMSPQRHHHGLLRKSHCGVTLERGNDFRCANSNFIVWTDSSQDDVKREDQKPLQFTFKRPSQVLGAGNVPVVGSNYLVLWSRHSDVHRCLGEGRRQLHTSGGSANSVREDHQATLQAMEQLVDYSRLSPQEILIHQRHKQAVENGKDFYTDPATGYQVITRLSHLRRGECCGNACRHCPYGHASVPDKIKKKKVFNSAFYV